MQPVPFSIPLLHWKKIEFNSVNKVEGIKFPCHSLQKLPEVPLLIRGCVFLRVLLWEFIRWMADDRSSEQCGIVIDALGSPSAALTLPICQLSKAIT